MLPASSFSRPNAQVTELRPSVPPDDVARPAWNGWAICPHVLTIYRTVGLGEYDIDLESITHQGAWHWLQHLSAKNWATDEVLAGFIRAVGASLGTTMGTTSAIRTTHITEFAIATAGTHPIRCYQDVEGA